MNQSVPVPRQLPPPLGLARPEFRWEPFSDCIQEAQPLLKRHWEEIALNKDTIPLDPDWDAYFALERVGRLHVLTARVDGHLVGYCSLIMGFLLHYRTVQYAQGDIFWLDPAYRTGLTGYHLLKLARSGMRALGCRRIDMRVKLHFQGGSIGKLLERAGLTAIETIYSEVFDGHS